MDRLLWSNNSGAAARQLAFTSPAKRAVFAARLAMRSKAVDAALQAAAVEAANPALVRTDPGYITAKATWLRTSGRDGEERALPAGQCATAPDRQNVAEGKRVAGSGYHGERSIRNKQNK